MSNADEYLMWADIETNGLVAEDCSILEVGLRLTDLDLVTHGNISIPIYWSDAEYMRDTADDFVRDMHDANGLWEACAVSSNPMLEEAIDRVLAWLEHIEKEFDIEPGTMPMCGSSLRMDRAFLYHWMEPIDNWFHYRIIDNSSIKEVCRRYNPELYAKLPEIDSKTHRVDVCLDGTVEEFRFYKDNFIFEAGE